MTKQYDNVVKTAQDYYNSDDADNFYFHIWGGEDIHIGLYDHEHEDIRDASERTVMTMSQMLGGLDQNSKVIDLGSGYGGAARKLVRKYGCHVTCVNLSEAQNVRNRELSAAQGLSDHIDVIDGSFESLDFPDNSFDFAWSQDAVLHSGQRALVLAEVNRVLKSGGEIIFTDPMQSDDCPAGVLQPVLDRIHLSTLGSFAFYRGVAEKLSWQEIQIMEMTPQLIRHYSRVKEELTARSDELQQWVSNAYIERMLQGLDHWVEAGKNGYLSWGIMHFRTA